MKEKSLTHYPLDFHGNELWLLPEKAIYWPLVSALIISDPHFGKSRHFQKNGIPVPSANTGSDLEKLAVLKQKHPFSHLIVTGDLFHSRINHDWDILVHWLDTYSISLSLIKGNHDILPAAYYQHERIKVFKPGSQIHGLDFYHEPHPELFGSKGFCGHLHPAVSLNGSAGNYGKAECFCLYKDTLVLPAFGSFTGNLMVQRKDYDQMFLIAGSEILPY